MWRRSAGRSCAAALAGRATGLPVAGAAAPSPCGCCHHTQRELLRRHPTETYQCKYHCWTLAFTETGDVPFFSIL